MKTLARPGDQAEALRRLRTVRPDTPARWGRMSAHQMVCHLSDAFLMAGGKTSVTPTGGLLPPAALKWIALYLPLPWPPGVLTSPEIDQACSGTRPVAFAADVDTLERLVERFPGDIGRFHAPRHPAFGRMSRADWLRWGYLHLDHHLRQFGA